MNRGMQGMSDTRTLPLRTKSKQETWIRSKGMAEPEETLEYSDAKCPYCGKMQRDSWELHLSDGESTDVECSLCEKTFTVTFEIQTWYRGTPKRGGADDPTV